jgi:hypothetical protein
MTHHPPNRHPQFILHCQRPRFQQEFTYGPLEFHSLLPTGHSFELDQILPILNHQKAPPTIETLSFPPDGLVSVSPTALAGGFTYGFTSHQALGIAFLKPCRIPLRVRGVLALMGGVRAAPAADARFALIRVSSRIPTFCLPPFLYTAT